MNETAVSNTGPMRHLFEIGQVHTLGSTLYLSKAFKVRVKTMIDGLSEP